MFILLGGGHLSPLALPLNEIFVRSGSPTPYFCQLNLTLILHAIDFWPAMFAFTL